MKTINNLGALGAACLLAVSIALGPVGCAGDRYTQSTGEYIDDSTISHHVKGALSDDSYKYPDVKVTTFKGSVQLSGFVDDKAQKERAATLAKSVPGVKEVINNITVKG